MLVTKGSDPSPPPFEVKRDVVREGSDPASALLGAMATRRLLEAVRKYQFWLRAFCSSECCPTAGPLPLDILDRGQLVGARARTSTVLSDLDVGKVPQRPAE